MDRLAPHHVPCFASRTERRQLWTRCREREQPVVAIRDARRGYIVRYDLQHLDRQLEPSVLRRLRDRTRSWRDYPTGADPISEAEGVGGEAGPVAGALHTETEAAARDLAARLSEFVFEAPA